MWEAGLSGKKKLQVKVRGIQVFLSRVGRMAGPRLPAVTLIHMERALEGGSGDPNALVPFLPAVIASSARPGDWSAELSVCSSSPQGSEMLTALLRKVKGSLVDSQQEGVGQKMLSHGCKKPDTAFPA